MNYYKEDTRKNVYPLYFVPKSRYFNRTLMLKTKESGVKHHGSFDQRIFLADELW